MRPLPVFSDIICITNTSETVKSTKRITSATKSLKNTPAEVTGGGPVLGRRYYTPHQLRSTKHLRFDLSVRSDAEARGIFVLKFYFDRCNLRLVRRRFGYAGVFLCSAPGCFRSEDQACLAYCPGR